MSEMSLDVIVRIIQEGGKPSQDQIAALRREAQGLGRDAEVASQALQKLQRPTYSPSGNLGAAPALPIGGGNAAEAQRRLLESGYPEAGKAVEELGKKTEETAKKKDKLAEAFTFARLAAGGFTGVLASGLGMLARWIASTEEAARKAAEFGNIAEKVDPLKVLREGADAAREGLLRTYDDIARSVNSLNAQFAELNANLILQQQLTQKIDDAELAKGLAGIDARRARGQITESQANRERSKLNQEALQRRDAREIEGIDRQRLLEEGRAAAAGMAQGNLEPQLTATQQALVSQQDQANRVKVISDESVKQAGVELEKQRGLKRLFDDLSENPAGPLDMVKLAKSGMFAPGFVPTKEGAANLAGQAQERINDLLKVIEQAKTAAAKEERRVAELKAEEASIMKQLTELEQAQLEAQKRATQLTKEVEMRRQAQQKIEGIRGETSAVQRGAAEFGEDRAARVRAMQIQIERALQAEAGMGKDDPRRMTSERERVRIQNEIDALKASPENRGLIDEKNKTRTAETEEQIRERERREFIRDNQVNANEVGAAVARPAGELVDITKAVVVAVKMGYADSQRQIAGLRAEVRDLQSRFDTSRS